MNGEISYDLVMEEDMAFVEATFRLPGDEWQVLIVSKRDTDETRIRPCTWESGVRGFAVHVPKSTRLNRKFVEEMLSVHLGVDEWTEVRGPDSLKLR